MQEQLLRWFIEGGMFMWFTLLAGILSLIVTIVLISGCSSQNKKLCQKVIVFFIFTPLMMGALGMYYNYNALMSAIVQVDPALKQEIYVQSMVFARMPLILGAITTALLMAAGLVGLGLFRR